MRRSLEGSQILADSQPRFIMSTTYVASNPTGSATSTCLRFQTVLYIVYRRLTIKEH